MAFFGQPDSPPVGSDDPLRKFTYKTWGGILRTVHANYLQFTSEHVTFWIKMPDGQNDRLVLAESNRDVNHLEETPT